MGADRRARANEAAAGAVQEEDDIRYRRGTGQKLDLQRQFERQTT